MTPILTFLIFLGANPSERLMSTAMICDAVIVVAVLAFTKG